MQSNDKRAERKSGQPDPVARVSSADLEASQAAGKSEGENEAIISAEEASKRHASADAKDVDLAAGGEFIQMQPNDFPSDKNRKSATTEDLTPEERAAEPPAIDSNNPVDEAAIDSFPASDPPSFTPTRAGRASPDPVDHRP